MEISGNIWLYFANRLVLYCIGHHWISLFTAAVVTRKPHHSAAQRSAAHLLRNVAKHSSAYKAY